MACPWLGAPTGRDQHVFRPHGLAGSKAKRVAVLEHSAGLDDARAGVFNVRRIDAFEPRDLLVLIGDQGRPVEGRRRNRPSKSNGVLDLVANMRPDDEKFFRDAAADHAGAAEPILFGNDDARAVPRGNASSANATRTATDDK